MAREDLLFGSLFDSCPETWDVVPFEEAIDFQEGPGIMAVDFHETGVPLIRLSGVQRSTASLNGCNFLDPEKVGKKWNHFRLKRGDLLISTSATIGMVSEIGSETEGAVAYTGLIRLRPRTDKVWPGFIKYFASSSFFVQQAEGMAAGSVLRHFGPSHLRQMAFPVPPLDEQKAIAAVLGALDDKIELNRRMNATLEAMARTLFQSWFVDFDPVRAKLDGRQPVGLAPDTAALFPEHLEDSLLGAIPKGWQVQRIREVVEKVFDGPHATPPNAEEGPVFLGIKNLTGSSLDLSDTRHISESDWHRWTKRVTPRPLDIVFSYEATLGFFALIPPGLRCCLGRRLALIRPRTEDGHSHFWFHQFIGPNFQRYLMQHSVQGATVDRIPLIHFPDYLVLNPPSALKEAFECRVALLWAKIHSNANQSVTLATLRNTLLPKYLSGELRVVSDAWFAEEASANL